MSENKQKISSRQEAHLEFSGTILNRRYNVFSGERYSGEDAYIDYNRDIEEPLSYEDANYEDKLNKQYDFIEDLNNIVDVYSTVY